MYNTPFGHTPNEQIKELVECENVPSAVHAALRRDRENNTDNTALLSGKIHDEKVLYCSPPSIRNQTSVFMDPLMISGLAMLIATPISSLIFWNLTLSLGFLLFGLFGLMWIAASLYIATPSRYGYRVITNYRAALVVLDSHYGIFGPRIVSSYFMRSYKLSIINNYVFVAKLIRDTFDSNVCDVYFGRSAQYGSICFERAPQADLIDNILTTVTQNLIIATPPNKAPSGLVTFGRNYENQTATARYLEDVNDPAVRGQKNMALVFKFMPVVIILTNIGVCVFLIVSGLHQPAIILRTYIGTSVMLLVAGFGLTPLYILFANKAKKIYEAACEGRSIVFGKIHKDGV